MLLSLLITTHLDRKEQAGDAGNLSNIFIYES